MRVGVDIGGTFTDLCVLDDTGIVAVGKTLTTKDEPARGVEEVLAATLRDAGIAAGDVTGVVHGTTLVTNALIERKGARTALLLTEGFRDITEMAREHRYELYDLMIELPRPLVPRHLRFGVPERMLADGSVSRELDVPYVERLARELDAAGVDAVAICFLHAFTNPGHERAAAEAIRRVAPRLRVGLSSDVVPEIREYERASTTCANVYVQGLAEAYLTDLRRRLAGLGIAAPPHIMLSNGGVATVDTAAAFPIRMLESGPAGGALAAAAFGGGGSSLAFDMGGTTAKLCVIEDGEPLITHQFEVDRVYRLRPGSGLPVKVPVIDMIEIGVGGGSIARVNALGLLTVGPDSAGSEPGPACYGRGGHAPTVTDADLVLGYLDPAYFLGGRMALDADAAWNTIHTLVAEPLGVDVPEAAWGIHTTTDQDMANAARVHAVERGQDPTGLPLFTFGGAGPVHGAGVAAALGASRVVTPPGAGVMSAVGMLTAPTAFDFVRSAHVRVADLTPDRLDEIFADMEAEGTRLLTGSGVRADAGEDARPLGEPGDAATEARRPARSGGVEVAHARFAEMRYAGQGAEIRVAVPDGAGADELTEAFGEAYRRLYARPGPDVPVEVLSWRLVSSGPPPDVTLRMPAEAAGAEARKGVRKAYFPGPSGTAGGYVDTPVYDRYALAPGSAVEGPALVEERESTLVVPPGAACVVAPDSSLIVDLRGTNG